MKVCSVCQRCYEDSVLSCSEENHESLVEARPGSRELILNYRLEFLHEISAATEIYEAVNTALNLPCLIKILTPNLSADEQQFKEQFLSEAKLISAFIHPNVVRVFDSGILPDGELYVVTELVKGQTLRNCLSDVGLPSEVTALTINRQAAEGLEAIHSAGVIHKNISPENIILTSDAEDRFLVKLQNIDFGGVERKIVNPSQLLGKLKYYSPEQCAGQTVDGQTDIYSLGVVLYETLTGHAPFDAPDAPLLIHKQINEPPPPVQIHSFDLRALLTQALTDSLQKTTRARLKTATAFARRLRHIEQLATHSSTPPPAMSYPATMNKSAVVFTPLPEIKPIPVKVENPVQVESQIIAPEPEIIEEIVETPKIAQVELLSPQESEVEEIFVENDIIKNEPDVQFVPIINEEIEQPEEQPMLIHSEAIESETQSMPGFEEEAKVFAEPEQVFEAENEPEFQTEIFSEENNEPEIQPEVFAEQPNKYVTQKLTPLFDESAEEVQTLVGNNVHLVDWEQPDDIPQVSDAFFEVKKPELVETQFSSEEIPYIEHHSVIDLDESEPLFDDEPETLEPRVNSDKNRLFEHYVAAETSDFLANRSLLTGVGIGALLILTVVGTIFYSQIQSPAAEQNFAKSVSKVESRPKIADGDISSTTKFSDLTDSNRPTLDENSAAPDYQLSGNNETPVAPEKTVLTVSQQRNQNPSFREVPKNRETTSPNKIPAKVSPSENNKAEVKTSPEKKAAPKSQISTSTKTDIFTRPRIVKNPKF